MLAPVPPLAFFCIHVLARVPDQLHDAHPRRIPASPALLDALAHAPDPCLWAALAQLVHPLPPDLHDRDLALSHPALPLLQKIPVSLDFTLVTLVGLPNCTHLRDDDIANLRFLHRLIALDLRGCSISSYAFTALARSLAAPLADGPARSGPCGLRLLSLHGCLNITTDVLPALTKFPLLSAIDLRFTRCVPSAVNAHLSPLGFRPSNNNSLFHPASLSLGLCSLEKAALTAPDPTSLYSCPPELVFRIHVNKLSHLQSPTKKFAPVASSSTIRTISSAEETVVFIAPPRKQTKNDSFPPYEPSVSSTVASVVPTSSLINRPTHPIRNSNASTFYQNAPAHSRKNILPLSAQAVQSSECGKLDPLAVARSPSPWKSLDTYNFATSSNTSVAITCRQSVPGCVESACQSHPIARWMGQALNNPLKVDRARLHKHGSDAVADMVHQFASKRPKIESEFVLAKMRNKVSVMSRNPFVRSARSVFAESNTNGSDKPRSPAHKSQEVQLDMQLQLPRSLSSKTVQEQGTNDEGTPKKPLKPITSLKPPILPRELLPSMPQHTSKPRTDLKQTRLSFAREVE